MPIKTEHDPRLKLALKRRHISMLALGCVIGAGQWAPALLSLPPDRKPSSLTPLQASSLH